MALTVDNILTPDTELIRYSDDKYIKLLERTEGDFWTHTSTNYSKDYMGFLSLNQVEQNVFECTIGYQSKMDGGVSHGYSHMAVNVGYQPLALLYSFIAMNEGCNHALTYAYGLTQVFGDDAEEILAKAEKDPEIALRMAAEEGAEADFIKNPKDLKKLIKFIIYTYLLEAIKFPLSFYLTFKINDRNHGAIQGFSQALKEIAQDELVTHVTTNKSVLKDLMKSDPTLTEYIKEVTYERIKAIRKEEERWAKNRLFQKGTTSYLNMSIYTYLLEYFSDKALADLGFEKLYGVEKNTEIDWFNSYRQPNGSVTAQQETDSVGYSVRLHKDLDELDKEEGPDDN